MCWGELRVERDGPAEERDRSVQPTVSFVRQRQLVQDPGVLIVQPDIGRVVLDGSAVVLS